MKSKFDVMKVFTTFICAAKNKLSVQLIFRRENKSCKDLHGIKFTFYS